MNHVSEFSKTQYNSASEYLGPKWAQMEKDYAPQIDQAKVQYDIARMYAKGYVNESVTDTSTIKYITAFEAGLPLRNISLVEYERRLKKLVTPDMNDKATIKMVIECFKDHWAFLDIADQESLTHELMFDKLFIVDDNSVDEDEEPEEEEYDQKELHVPMLMLLGLLYCRSNRR